MRKIHLLIILSFIVEVLWASSSGYAFKNPDIDLKEVRIIDMDQSAITLEGTLEINNPNDTAARFSGYDFQLDVEGQRLSFGKSGQPFQIPALGIVTIAVPATVLFDDLSAVGRKGVFGRDLVYVLKGTVFLDTFLGKVPLPFSYQDTLNLSNLLREKTRQFFQGL